jgi:hypothetical protein
MSLPVPATWRDLPGELAPVFARRPAHRLFAALACGKILADRSTAMAMAMAAAGGMAGKRRRACRLFSGAAWDIAHLGLAVAQLVVKYLAGEGEPVVVACKPYHLGLLTLDTEAGPAAIAERHSWRRAIQPSNAAGKQIPGAGDACNPVKKAVGRTVPSGSLIQSLLVCWHARSACSPAGIDRRPRLCP